MTVQQLWCSNSGRSVVAVVQGLLQMIRVRPVTTRSQYKDITGIIHKTYFIISQICSRTVVVSFILKILLCKYVHKFGLF